MASEQALRVRLSQRSLGVTVAPGPHRTDLNRRFTAIRCTIDMRGVQGCQVLEIDVERTDDYRFWCRARRGPQSAAIELGPAMLGPDGSLTERWGGAKHLLGGAAQVQAFLDALRGFLVQRRIVAEDLKISSPNLTSGGDSAVGSSRTVRVVV